MKEFDLGNKVSDTSLPNFYLYICVYIIHTYTCMCVCVCVSIGSFPCGSVVKNLSANAGGASSIPGLGRSPGGGNGSPFQFSCLDLGAWWAMVRAVAKSRT